MTILIVVLIVLIGAAFFGFRQAMAQASLRPAARPRAYEATDPQRVRRARAEWQREGWKWPSKN